MESIRTPLDRVEGAGRTLTVYDPGDVSVLDRIEAFFGPQRVDVVVSQSTASDAPEDFAVLHDDGEFVAASPLDAVEDVVEFDARVVRDPEFDRDDYPDVLKHEDTTAFTSYSKRDMIIASREVESRAWNGGAGVLRAGFQTLSNLEPQWRAYRQLASTDLDVHVYGRPDWEPPAGAGVTVHSEDTPEVRESWFVVYDGDGLDRRKAALVAHERDDTGRFHGFWTYEPALVDEFLAYLRAGGVAP